MEQGWRRKMSNSETSTDDLDINEHDIGWPQSPLGEIASFERTSIGPAYVGGDTLYVGLENITSSGQFVSVGPARDAGLKSSKTRFDRNHILYGKLGVHLSKIAAPDFDGVCSTDILPIRPGPKMSRRFLMHYLRLPKSVAFAINRSVGSSHSRVRPSVLQSLMVPVPPLEVQRRIEDRLDAAELLRVERANMLCRIRGLSSSVFVEYFGNPVTNVKGWPLGSLVSLGTVERGVSKHRPRNDPILLGGDWPLVQTGDVASSDGYIRAFSATYSDEGLAQSRLWPSGTLCITIAANIAKTGILTFDACFPDSVVGFTGRFGAATEYVRGCLNFLQPMLEMRAPESAQKNINLKVLRGIEIPIPPRNLMDVYAKRISEINELVLLAKNQLQILETLIASLQQRAFRGEL